MMFSLATNNTSCLKMQSSSCFFGWTPGSSSSSSSETSRWPQTLHLWTSSIFSFLPIIQLALLQMGQNLSVDL
eukprot:CAMPEP_0171056880 /NCGR_PEP_ID=MMETSP0766_2-20121228/1396_1 /TAXON_ID=439317 /ORGANISM="Gambierdiscus australes, Strain CAWD 149" /LENGTH=72 /DNA_ID=CAMNT_0011511881 /DNA_START=319 /DNA_END=537 /DNA_ORIENTATION=-